MPTIILSIISHNIQEEVAEEGTSTKQRVSKRRLARITYTGAL
jgi:hypothetical protein